MGPTDEALDDSCQDSDFAGTPTQESPCLLSPAFEWATPLLRPLCGLRKFTIEFSKRPMKWCLTFWNGLMKQCLRCPAEYEATVNYCAKDGRS